MAQEKTKLAKKHKWKTDVLILKRVTQAFGPYKSQTALIGGGVLLTIMLSLIPPLVVRAIFDTAIPQHNLRLLFLYVLLLLVVPVVTGGITVGQTYLSSVVGQHVVRDFRNKLYCHLQRMSFRFFTSTHVGEIQSRLSNDVTGIQTVVTNTATQVLSNVAITLSAVIAMLYISPLLTLITFGLLPLFIWVTNKVGNIGRRTQGETQQGLASLSALMQETLSVSGILLIKAFGRQQFAQERFAQENQRLADLGVRLQVLMSWFGMLVNIIFAIMPALVYLVAGGQIIENTHQPGITIGGIIAFTTLQASLIPAVGQLLTIQVQILSAFALFDRMFEYLDLPIEIEDTPDALHLAPEMVQGAIDFQDVTFHYKRDEPQPLKALKRKGALDPEAVTLGKTPQDEQLTLPTLHHVSFHIQPGKLAALVGPSGAGKTTLTYLLLRLYDVDGGAISIDGHNIKSLSQASLSNFVGIVTQETYLFHTSIRENLLYANPHATEEEMIAATQAAAIHERILQFDEGYNTIVGERGYKLSGGEKQRIAIARVLLKNPRIFILDEATSSLDTQSERLIQAALEPLMKKRTTIAIAHRLSTILAADMILVVDQGAIVEQGTHEELLQRNGLYKQLYTQQFYTQAKDDSVYSETARETL